MVKLPSGNEVILLGCENDTSATDSIYKITWQGEDLQWEILPQKLKYPRSNAIAMLIPDSMTECTTQDE